METILIIDDEFIVRTVLGTYLGHRGYQILDACAGPEGLALAVQARPDLVLLDITMEGMDGIEVCRRLRADPATSVIPVIFMSGSSDLRNKVLAFQAGAVDYVTKPFQMTEVVHRVETHLGLQRQRRELQRASENLREALDGARLLNRKLIEVNERLRESEQVKGEFLATMRNEINNPLTGIMGLARELGQADPGPERVRALAGLIGTEAFNLDFQIRNVFCASELEAGESAPAVAQVDLGALLGDVNGSFQHLAEAQGVQLRLLLDPPAAVFATDPRLLELALANLVSNAIKYSDHGGEVLVRAGLGEDGLTLAVVDHGIGIREQDREAIFTRFHQLSSGHQREHLGQGLGLAIVKALAELLGGSLALAGAPGQGSTFTLVLPRIETGAAPLSQALAGNFFLFDEPEEK